MKHGSTGKMNNKNYIFISLLISIGIISCKRTKLNKAELICEVNCDSVSYEYDENKLVGAFAYSGGQKLGGYMLFNNDTIYGYSEFVSDYFKRTFGVKNDSFVIVELFTLMENEYILSERVAQKINGDIIKSASHFISIDVMKDSILFQPIIHADFDYVNLINGDIEIARIDSAELQLRIHANDLVQTNDIFINIIKLDSIDSNGVETLLSVTMQLPKYRMFNSKFILAPNEWVLSKVRDGNQKLKFNQAPAPGQITLVRTYISEQHKK